MRIDFRVSDNPHIRTFVDYQSISLRREGSFDSHGTDKAREKIRTFVLAEAEKLFKDPEFSEKANSREIWSYLSRAESEVSELNAKLMVAQQRVAELKAQFSRNGDFCLAIADKYRNKVCKRPKGHTGAHNDFSR
jgi:cytochrome c556